MKSFLSTVVFLLFCVFLKAQQKEIDSLNHLLQIHKTADANRLHLLNSLAYYYATVNVEKGLELSSEAIAIAERLNDKAQLGRAYINKANNYITAGKDSLALNLLHKVMEFPNADKNSNGEVFYGIAKIHQNWSQYDTAINFYQQAYPIFEAKKDYLNVAKMLNGMGICYMYSSNYPKALETYIQALHYYEIDEQTHTLGYANVLSNIGLIYGRMEYKLQFSLEYYERALRIYKQNDYKLGIANTLSNMANVYDNLNEPLKAIDLQKQAYDIFEAIGNKPGMASALTNIGIAYTSVPDYQQSIHYLQQTLPIYKEMGNINNLGIVEYYMGETFLEMPITQANISKAEQHLNQAIILGKETNNMQTQADAYNLLSKLYSKKSDYRKALEYKELAITLKDSLNSQDLKDEITRLEVKYEYEKQANLDKAENEKKQALAQAEVERHKLIRNGSIIGGVVLISGILFGFILYWRKRQAEFNAKVSDTELKALRAQMNPHFIFNSLNSINDFISKNDVESASNYLIKFAKIMRQTLENSMQNAIPLEEDLKMLELYLQVESMRLNNKFTYTINIDNAIDVENTLVPPLILQPFIENSIWHGLSNKASNGHIDISIKKEGNMLVCIVDDNGVGRTLKPEVDSIGNKSLGIRITKSRIDILNKKKYANGSLKVIDKEQGVRVEVKLPLQVAF
jgi:tetratricopeptide (TPR) repeat protein